MNRRKADAGGQCSKKKCDTPSSYAFPSKRIIDEVMRSFSAGDYLTAILEELRSTPYAPPVLEYNLVRNTDGTYDANLQPDISTPWDAINMKLQKVPESDKFTSSKSCSVTAVECAAQRAAIISVLTTLNVGYKNGVHECQWKGVMCNDLNLINQLQIINLQDTDPFFVRQFPSNIVNLTHLERVFLTNNGIIGQIHPEVGNLTEMQIFYLENNQLTGTIPTEFGKLTNMTDLYLGQNPNLGGVIPTELGNLPLLETLSLYNCSLSSTLPAELGSLTSAKNIILNNNNLDGQIDVFFNLTTLKALQLDENAFTGPVSAAAFQPLVLLETLTMSRNQLTGAFPDFLNSLPLLTDLILGWNSFDGALSANIENLTNLENFDAANCAFTGAMPVELGGLTNLEVLNVYGNTLASNIPAELGGLKALEKLILANNAFVGAIPAEFGNLESVKTIDLSNNQLTGIVPAALGELSTLTALYLADNSVNSADGVIDYICDLGAGNYSFDAVDFPNTTCTA